MISTVTHLREVAAVLREHHLQELAERNLKLCVDLEVPLLKNFAHLAPEDLLALTVQGLDTFLRDLETGRALETAAESLRSWEENRMEGITTEQVSPSDMVLVSAAQRQAIVGMLDRIVPDAKAAVAIAVELESFYSATQAQSSPVTGSDVSSQALLAGSTKAPSI